MEKNISKCKIHPTETITNYCIQTSCYTQLCAACICDHTQAHNQINTKPKFQLLKNTYQNTNDNICKFKDILSYQKNRVTNVLQKISKQKSQVQIFLKQARQQAISTVHRSFDQLQLNYYNHLEQQKQKTGLLNEIRLNQIYSQINQSQLQICSITEQLNSYKCPKIIRNINNQFIPSLRNYIEQISKQLLANQNFQPSLMYRPANLQEIATAVKKLFTTSISYNIGQYNRATRSISKNRDHVLKCMSSNTNIGNLSNTNREYSLRKQSVNGIRNQGDINMKSPRFTQFRKKNNMAVTMNQNYYSGKDQYQYKMFSNTYT